MSDTISRQAAIDAMFANMPGLMFNDVLKILRTLPSVHPEMDEWCTECKEYDHEKHCCPRFNRVIREALAERKTGRWITDYLVGISGASYRIYRCSECASYYESVGLWPRRYCPNCGARMEDSDG